MSGYLPLARDSIEDTNKGGEVVPLMESDHWADEKPRQPQRNYARAVYVALALVLVNVLVWAIAAWKLAAIYDTIRANLDVVDTRMLPRPDAGNGVKLSVQS
uniref:DHA14-like major facilitator n=1 Tax=Ganoderma boninense TaxID=34458 RepID=A0A5K1K832_9APHY|nr:DHA14-like major facilitator [Ganoderma boninense]